VESDVPEGCLVAVVGPTAVGKTGVGHIVAREIGAEVVSADSMQIWRGMDIGTAKPGLEERREIRYHLVDVADPLEDFSVAQFRSLAEAAVQDITSRGKSVVLVGGTGLYVRAVVDKLGFAPRPAPGVRERLLLELERGGALALHDRLREVDPASAARLSSGDTRRVIRALEVYETSGRPLSSYQEDDRRRRAASPWTIFGLMCDTAVLDSRIYRRVDQMVSAGLMDEVQSLMQCGLRRNMQAARALGYAEVMSCLEGEMAREEAVAAIKLHTRRFAKRQRTWFRADPRIQWLDATCASAGQLASVIVQALRGGGAPGNVAAPDRPRR